MNDSAIVASCLAGAIVLAGIVSALTESPAVLGLTAVGIAIYLAVGVGMPQYVLSRRSGSSLQLGLAAFAVIGAVIATAVEIATGSLHEESGIGLVSILLVVLLGNAIGAGAREFRAGYRSES
ncbi:hypothetical protein HYG81_01265 [Natrinema zhouii]|uniref:Uncharacterized protein n=1 Tax=Natrinema zhouii TaxID=1710539 RepID=A0A7D6GR43_9EURY|nr:hypothetical protein [Natrinema zhouii]QLK26282.1 hypothetical protein HYG81_01265 [Natrinema zhouii]